MQKNSCDYPVEITTDAFGESETLAGLMAGGKTLIVADANTVQRIPDLGRDIGRYVRSHDLTLAGSPLVMSGGERLKTDNLQSALRAVQAILNAKLGPKDCVLAIGGGALLDVVGYATAQTRGNVRLVRVPTTPLAAVDAAFASYAAVDMPNVKDALRIASVPSAVVIDFALGRTVMDGVWRAGYAACVRQGLVTDAALMKKLLANVEAFKNRDYATAEKLLEATVQSRLKKGATPFAEWSVARLEPASGYKLPHGYAIAIAICIDMAYAVAKENLKQETFDTVRAALTDVGTLEALFHSQHLLQQPDLLVCGLDAWALATGSSSIVLPSALGKGEVETEPDRDAYRRVMRQLCPASVPKAK